MKPQFQNSYTITCPLLAEYFNKVTKFRWLAIVIFFLIAGVALTAIMLYTHAHLFAAVLVSFFIASMFLLPFRSWWGAYDHAVKRLYDRMLLDKNDDLKRVVELSDRITSFMPSLQEMNVCDYSQIKKVITGKTIYILVLQKKRSVILAKGCFTIGDEQAFLPFIRSRHELAAPPHI